MLLILDFEEDQDSLRLESLDEWARFCNSAPVGSCVRGKVVAVRDYGIYCDIGSKFPLLVEVPNLANERLPITPDLLPSIGEQVIASVIQHVDTRRLVRGIEVDER